VHEDARGQVRFGQGSQQGKSLRRSLKQTLAYRKPQPVIRLYSVPADTFVGQDEEEEEEVDEEEA
jgi:hypothetical protein